MKVGIIGCGAIGGEIARAILDIPGLKLVSLSDVERDKAERLSLLFQDTPAIDSLSELISRVDLIIESASQEVAKIAFPLAIENGKDMMIMSVGGLLGREDLLALAEKKGIRVYLPSGAIAGVDGLKAASCANVEGVTLTTRKPPLALKDAPYLKDINLSEIKEERVVFSGTAEEAIKGFPANINVAAVLSLSGIGIQKTRVKIVADPKIDKNIHEIEIIGRSGRIFVRCENLPSPTNPKTSYLASLSAIALLKQIASPVKIGT
ncbi:MAG: aspartate dehydrogenase [bacterium]|nr:aspartate dehydrogenase [bacterium]